MSDGNIQDAQEAELARLIVKTLNLEVQPSDIDPQAPLYGEGLGLDSLEAAELSAVLEDAFGTDPFSGGDRMPETVGEILGFYEVAQSA